jgi:hypothetical protein
MNPNDKDRFAEELLDASLQRYRIEEPRPGLEARILANLRANEQAVRPKVWVWALVAGAAMLTVAVVFLHLSSRLPSRTATVSPAPQAVAPKGETPKAVAVAPPVARVPRKPSPRPRPATARHHRPEQFPTPSPLTEQEALLMQYVEATASSALPTQENRLRQDQDLSISGLTIAALAPIKPIFESDEETKD